MSIDTAMIHGHK